jgi:hypothetical protein
MAGCGPVGSRGQICNSTSYHITSQRIRQARAQDLDLPCWAMSVPAKQTQDKQAHYAQAKQTASIRCPLLWSHSRCRSRSLSYSPHQPGPLTLAWPTHTSLAHPSLQSQSPGESRAQLTGRSAASRRMRRSVGTRGAGPPETPQHTEPEAQHTPHTLPVASDK